MAIHNEYAEYFLAATGWTQTQFHKGEDNYALPKDCLRAFQAMVEEGTNPTPGMWAKEIYRSEDSDYLKAAISEHGELPSGINWLKEKGFFTPETI